MSISVRDRILDQLQRAPACSMPGRPAVPMPEEAGMDKEGRTSAFCQRFADQTGIVYQLAPNEDLSELLCRIFAEHELCRAIASSDAVLAQTCLARGAGIPGLEIRNRSDYSTRRAFKKAVFDDADAGITGADFGIAESGTLVLAFDSNHARLISLAPNVHIVLLPQDRIVGTYEQALAGLCAPGKTYSQIALITGPSMTADIQGKPFKGMHGPRKIIAVLI